MHYSMLSQPIILTLLKLFIHSSKNSCYDLFTIYFTSLSEVYIYINLRFLVSLKVSWTFTIICSIEAYAIFVWLASLFVPGLLFVRVSAPVLSTTTVKVPITCDYSFHSENCYWCCFVLVCVLRPHYYRASFLFEVYIYIDILLHSIDDSFHFN